MSTEQAVTPTPSHAVSEAYRKAHKSYVLISGLLASWELIGITLDTKEKWGIELKSPSAIPLVLVTLVFYSAYKMTIEWLQCDAEARNNSAAKLDFKVAHGIAIAATAISIVQYLWRIQIVNVIKARITHQDSIFVVALLSASVVSVQLWEGGTLPKLRKIIVTCAIILLYCVSVLAAIDLFRHTGAIHGVITMVIGIVLAGTAGIVARSAIHYVLHLGPVYPFN